MAHLLLCVLLAVAAYGVRLQLEKTSNWIPLQVPLHQRLYDTLLLFAFLGLCIVIPILGIACSSD